MIKFEFVKRITEKCELVDGEYKNELGIIRLPERATKRAAGYDFIYNDVENTTILPEQMYFTKDLIMKRHNTIIGNKQV